MCNCYEIILCPQESIMYSQPPHFLKISGQLRVSAALSHLIRGEVRPTNILNGLKDVKIFPRQEPNFGRPLGCINHY